MNRSSSSFAALAILIAAALGIMLPEIVTGLTLSDSLRYNIVWLDQFRELFRAGDLYPRRLPLSWGGLGSPTFYFYPPVYFWTASLIDVATFASLPSEKLGPVTTGLFLAVSGFTMRKWLAPIAGDRAALIGALAYMASPYHLYDIYSRGAVAEACGYALVPIILLSLRGLANGRIACVGLLGLSYAALVMAHLPIALLTSIFLIPPYALFEARRRGGIRYVLLALLGGALGLGVAAVYLLPALTLTAHVASEALFGGYYSAENWFFWKPGAWPKSGPMILVVPLSFACLLLSLAAMRSAPADARSDTRLWAGVAIATVVMISGILPFLWRLPYLAQVQFPWRLLLIAEFATITALANSKPRLANPFAFAGAVPAVVAATTAITMVPYSAQQTARLAPGVIGEIRSEYRDAPEYLPAAFPIVANEEGAPDPGLIKLPPPAGAAIASGERPFRVHVVRDGSTVRVPLFYFPNWRVMNSEGREVLATPDSQRLLSFKAAKAGVYTVAPGEAPLERAATLISLLALLGLAGAAFFLRFRSNPMSRQAKQAL